MEDIPMRKPRDFDAELRALNDRARQLRARKVQQLGELVIACQADTMPVEQLAGALLAAVGSDTATKEAWRERGAAFFQGTAPAVPGRNRQRNDGAQAGDGAAASAAAGAGSQ
jgi:DNA-binding protein H-NS